MSSSAILRIFFSVLVTGFVSKVNAAIKSTPMDTLNLLPGMAARFYKTTVNDTFDYITRRNYLKMGTYLKDGTLLGQRAGVTSVDIDRVIYQKNDVLGFYMDPEDHYMLVELRGYFRPTYSGNLHFLQLLSPVGTCENHVYLDQSITNFWTISQKMFINNTEDGTLCINNSSVPSFYADGKFDVGTGLSTSTSYSTGGGTTQTGYYYKNMYYPFKILMLIDGDATNTYTEVTITDANGGHGVSLNRATLFYDPNENLDADDANYNQDYPNNCPALDGEEFVDNFIAPPDPVSSVCPVSSSSVVTSSATSTLQFSSTSVPSSTLESYSAVEPSSIEPSSTMESSTVESSSIKSSNAVSSNIISRTGELSSTMQSSNMQSSNTVPSSIISSSIISNTVVSSGDILSAIASISDITSTIKPSSIISTVQEVNSTASSGTSILISVFESTSDTRNGITGFLHQSTSDTTSDISSSILSSEGSSSSSNTNISSEYSNSEIVTSVIMETSSQETADNYPFSITTSQVPSGDTSPSIISYSNITTSSTIHHPPSDELTDSISYTTIEYRSSETSDSITQSKSTIALSNSLIHTPSNSIASDQSSNLYLTVITTINSGITVIYTECPVCRSSQSVKSPKETTVVSSSSDNKRTTIVPIVSTQTGESAFIPTDMTSLSCESCVSQQSSTFAEQGLSTASALQTYNGTATKLSFDTFLIGLLFIITFL